MRTTGLGSEESIVSRLFNVRLCTGGVVPYLNGRQTLPTCLKNMCEIFSAEGRLFRTMLILESVVCSLEMYVIFF